MRVEFPSASLAWKAEELRRNGQTVVLIAMDGQEAGLIGIADSIKPASCPSIAMRDHGLPARRSSSGLHVAETPRKHSTLMQQPLISNGNCFCP